jgi:hypothetical protein
VNPGYNVTARQAALALQTAQGLLPDYCNSSSTNSLLDYSPERVWLSPQCIAYYTDGEFAATQGNDLWVTTNFVQRTLARACDAMPMGNTTTLLDPVATVNLISVGQNCSVAVTAYQNAYIFQPELISFTLQPSWGVSFKPGLVFESMALVDKTGKPIGTAYQYGSTMTVSLNDFLLAAGVTLDTLNVGGEGAYAGATGPYGLVQPPAVGVVPMKNEGGPNGTNLQSPAYRTTGVTLRAKVTISNYRTSSPVNFSVAAAISVEVASPGSWTSAPPQIEYQGGPGASYDTVWTERRRQGVRVQFVSAGAYGKIDPLAGATALLNAAVLAFIAMAFTDCVAAYTSEAFRADKHEDGGERQALQALLEKEADHGVPFNFEELKLRQANGERSDECYESAIFRLEKELEELRQGTARVKTAAAIIAEDIGLPGLLDDGGPPPEPLYKLLSPGNGDVILIFPGDNVVGRGLGTIKTATVSRKQVCISVDPESKRAFVRSMRAAKSPSLPAILRSSTQQAAWRPLTEKGQSLALGDTLCMQLRPAPPGQPPETKDVYRLVTLDTEHVGGGGGGFPSLKNIKLPFGLGS